MDIVYISQHYRTPAMKGGSRSYEFSRRLVDRGHRVNMLAAAPLRQSVKNEGVWWTTEEAGVTVHWCGVPYSKYMGFRERIQAFSRFALRATSRASALPQDVVFSTSTPLTVAIPGSYAALRNRVPMVFEVRDVWPEVPIAMGILRNPFLQRASFALEAWAYRSSDSIIALSPDMARSITSRFPGARVTVIPNCSDLSLFAAPNGAEVTAVRSSRPWLGDRPLLVYTGSLGAANGVGYLAQVADVLRSIAPEVRILVVGDGKGRDELGKLARRLGVWEKNLFVERSIVKRDVPALLAAADMCLSVFADVPALSANSPNKVFDAFAASRPVVINNGGWLAEVLRESGAGIAVPPDDPVAGAKMIAQHIMDSEFLARARSAAGLLARGQFNRDVLFEKFEEVLLSAVSRGARRGTRRRYSSQNSQE
ncbi:MAG: glycosyltransferase family 4 protein [Pseudonocardiales bacterium]